MTLIKSIPARRLAATVAAAATALALMTATAVPARASTESDSIARLIAALAAVAVLGNTLNDNDRRGQVVAPSQPARGNDRGGRADHDNRRERVQVLPQACAIEISGRRHSNTVYVERCLRRSGIEGRLPQQCATRVYLRNRPASAFGENCLRDAGFRVEGDRRRRH